MAVTTKQKREGNFVIIETYNDDKLTSKSLYSYYASYVASGSAVKRDYMAVVIPDGITDIGGYAFNKYPYGDQCKNIKCIYIPDSVKTIQPYAFTGCNNLEYVRMSTRIEWIGDNAFANLKNIKRMNIPKRCNFGCKYNINGKSVYKNELDQILPNTPKFTEWTPWICASSEFGYGTVIFESVPRSILQESLDKKEWVDVKNNNGLYQIKQDNIMRYYRIISKTGGKITVLTDIAKVYPLI